MTAGFVTRAVFQAGTLLLLSRWLGPSEYGIFAGLVAGTMLLWPFAGLGVTQLLIRNVAQAPETLGAAWVRSVRRIGATGVLLLTILLMGMEVLVKVDIWWGSVIAVGVSELIFAPLSMLAANACLAVGDRRHAVLLTGLVPGLRTVAISIAVLIDLNASLMLASWIYLLAALVGGAITLLLMNSLAGHGRQSRRLASDRNSWRGGLGYATSTALGSGYQEMDKVLVLHLLGAAVLGPYSVAFRVATLFTLPAAALSTALLPRFFAHSNAPSGQHLLRNSLTLGVLYGIVAGFVMFGTSHLVSFVFGSEYAAAASYLRWLAPWPLLFATHLICATALTGQGRQHARNFIECLGLLVVCAAGVWLLKLAGAKGAIWGLLVAEALMVGACLALLLRRRRSY